MRKQSSYRIVVAESSKSRDSRSIDIIGYYSPYKKDKPLTVDLEKVDKWVKQGAQMSEPAARLVEKARKAPVEPGTTVVTMTSVPKPQKSTKNLKKKGGDKKA